MQAELWKKVEELYQAALAEPPDKRAGFLQRASPDDPQVRAEVESLLDQCADSFLEASPLSSVTKPGVRLGNFEILERLGRGGMGEVWRARDTRLERDVAMKLLPVAFARDPDRIARFEQEARAASALNHPNIISVFDVGHENGTWWIVSELVDGESLRQLIDRGPLPARRVIEIGTQIAEGLAASHAAGVVHRDLKPGNIMLRRDGRVKIVDFGLAKREHPGAECTPLSHSGMVLGTAGYMSPEQVRGEAVDSRSDISSALA
jgi:eukaryotic-like serine/threonine-protein kinase